MGAPGARIVFSMRNIEVPERDVPDEHARLLRID